MIAQMNDAHPTCSQALPQRFPTWRQPEAHGPICARMRPAPGPHQNRTEFASANYQHPQVIPATSPILAFSRKRPARVEFPSIVMGEC